MHTKTPIMPLRLSSTLCFIFLLLLPATSVGLVAQQGCQDRCGNISVPLPFGVGSNCSFDPSFTITCNTSTYPPKAYLSIIDKEVVEINETYIRVKYPNLVSVCYDLSEYGRENAIITESYKDSTSVNLTGTPYMLSYKNKLTAIGCDDTVLLSNRSSTVGGCSAFCEDEKETGGIGYCPYNATSLGIGCCQAEFTGDTAMGAQLIDLSRKVQRSRKLFPCSYAFIQETEDINATVFSYPLYYLHNSTAFLNDDWASTANPPVVRLDLVVGAENCSRAKLNSTTYACRDEKSVCDDVDFDIYPFLPRGYRCSCVKGYEGNPYLLGGCKPTSYSSSSANYGCLDQCGKLTIPFPFGIGPKCYLAASFEIYCNTSSNPPKPYLSILKAEIIQFNSRQVGIHYPNVGYACYNWSDSEQRITKTEEQSLIIDLSKTQFTLTNESWITVVGCDDTLVGITRHANRTSVSSVCSAFCQSGVLFSDYQRYGMCPSVSSLSGSGNGCCRAPIPRGTSYLEANLSDFSGRWPRTNFSCSYSFLEDRDPVDYRDIYPISDNSTEILLDEPASYWRRTTFLLDWRIGALNCKEAQLNPTDYLCQKNTDCIDFDPTIGGYLCNCSKGYQGNPYLSPGCQDIDECADDKTNPCNSNSICNNSLGSVNCLCPKGYVGDGRKDGTGCIQLPPSKTKTIILIGVGSGLGFVLLLLICFWLYKVLKKRKEKITREKFFKRNGGLLLRQQTNEGALGKTKVFLAKELEVATDHFNENRILGHGGQGTVYKGMLSDGKIVAIKKSKLVEENQLEQFINEVAILSQINHRNVVGLLGCCLETEVPLLVYEFMPNGTLFDLIHDSNNEFPVPWNMRLKIATDIAGALAYLHSASSIPIYHRDIKSSNLLLDEKYVVKVSDFGTSRSIAVDQTHLTTLVKGMFGYLDPEYFQSSQFTEKSDVYSFGVVLLELLTGQKPISFDKTEEERGLATRFLICMEQNCVDTILDPQVLGHGRKDEVISVARLAQRCLNLKGKMRPTMKEVATELESFRMSQMSSGGKNEYEDMRSFEDMPTMISDIEYTWTGSYKNASAPPSDTHPLMFATN